MRTRANRVRRNVQPDDQERYIFLWLHCPPGKFAGHQFRFVLTSAQVLSGKQPWSEIREDVAIVLRLAKGHKPGRPASRTLDDAHWNLIQRCWSSIEERPTTGVIISAIQRFLSRCSHSRPLSDLINSWSSQADLGAESLSSLGHDPSEGSNTYVEDLQNRYGERLYRFGRSY